MHSKGVPEDVYPREQTSSKEAVQNEEPDSSSARGISPVPDKEMPLQNISMLEKVDMLAAQDQSEYQSESEDNSIEAFGHATESCKKKEKVEESEGWTTVGKGKGKAPEGGDHAPAHLSSSRFKQDEGTSFLREVEAQIGVHEAE
ncbi:hypothetical protein U1Q18_032679, partial [Sarracenia purpurea var. burkii]